MTTGTVKKLVSDRGFGFITADDGKDTSSIATSWTRRSTSTA